MTDPPGMAGSTTPPPVTRREVLAWALYDFANSGYTTVVLTTIFSAYFVAVVAGSDEQISTGTATLLWTVGISVANLIVLLAAPVVGATADHLAAKKRFLLATTVGCVTATALLAMVGPGDIVAALGLLVFSAVCFALGESLIGAFLPEIAPADRMGRISGYGWSLGYVGGLFTLGLCLLFMTRAGSQGTPETAIVPVTLLITAAVFALAALPTFAWLRERALPATTHPGHSLLWEGFARIHRTWQQAAHFRDLFRFLLCLILVQAGVSTVVTISAVYAREVFGFGMQDLVLLIMVVNVSAAAGAMLFGHVQDRIGSVAALALALLLWIAAIATAFVAERSATLWFAGNLIGAAMGSTQSGGRALIGRFTPPARSGEFFGLWGVVGRLAAIIGPMSYGLVSHYSGNLRLALLSTLAFFVAGLLLLLRVDEARGRRAAEGDTTTT